MRLRTMPAPILALVAVTAVHAAEATGGDGPFSFRASAGVEYDSNVAVLELDTASGESDRRALLDAGIGYDASPTERLGLKLRYDVSQTLHDEFDRFDLRVHRGSGELSWDAGRTDIGLAYQYADASLDDEGFLVLRRAAPSVSHLFGTTLFLRAELARSDKRFESDPGRDATLVAPGVDAFVFLDGVKRYVTFGYRHLDEDADDDSLDYTGSKLKARFVRRFGEGRGVTLEAALRHERREYDAPALPLERPREDERSGVELKLEWPIAERGVVEARYEFGDNRSTLDSLDFDEHVVSLEIGGRF